MNRAVHFQSAQKHRMLFLVAGVREHFLFPHVLTQMTRVQWVLPKMCDTFSSCRNNSKPKQTAAQLFKNPHVIRTDMVTDWYCLFRPSNALCRAKTSKKSALRVPDFVVYVRSLKETGCKYSFVCASVLPAIWQTIKQSCEHSLNSLMRKWNWWFLSNSPEWLGEVETAKWAVIT